MRHVPLAPENLAEWSRIAAESADAWFWHTRSYLDFVKGVGASALLEDLSFLLTDERGILAICPLILEQRDGHRRFSYLGEFVPGPAFCPRVSAATRAKALEYYADVLEDMAAMHGAAYARIVVPALARGSLASGGCTWNPLLRYGYLDSSTATQILTLSEDEDLLWSNVRKGHRADVKRAAKSCTVKIWDAGSITKTKFADYQALHARDAGRVTRSSATFDIMYGWIEQGNAVLVEAAVDGTPAAFSLLITFGEGCYYASACKDPDRSQIPAMHLIQWESVRWLKGRGYRYYDLGLQYFGPRWDHVPNVKDLSISSFKRGFGGATWRVDIVERFYSPETLASTGAERLRALVEHHAMHDRMTASHGPRVVTK